MKKDNEVVLPSSPADQANIKAVLDDIVVLMNKKDFIMQEIKDHVAGLEETYELPKSLINKMARTLYKENYSQLTKESETFELAFETIVKPD